MKKNANIQYILLLLLVCYLLTPAKSTAQDNIKWGVNKKNSKKRIMSKIFYLDSNSFIAARYNPGGQAGSHKYYFSRYVNFQATKEIEIKLPSSYGTTKLESINFLNDAPVVFFSDYKDGKSIVYAQKYNTNCETVGTPISIVEFATSLKINFFAPNPLKYCHFIYSQDKSKLAISMEGDENDSVKKCMYLILDEELNILTKGEYEQYEYRNIFLDGRSFLTNKGELFCLNTIEKTTKEENSNKGWILDHFLVYRINEQGLQKIKIPASDYLQVVSSVSININQANKIVINGVFGEKQGKVLSTKGVFNIMTHSSKENEITEETYRFEEGFVKDIWFENYYDGKQAHNFSMKKYKEVPNLQSKYFLTTQDGSMIGSYEYEAQIFVGGFSGPGPTSMYTAGPGGMTRTHGPAATSAPTASTISKGTFLFKIDSLGNFKWLVEIPKFEINKSSLNTSSYLFEHGNNLTLLFGDHLVNYAADGTFTGEPTTKITKAIAKKRVAAMVDVDLSNGETKRQCLTGKQTINLSPITKGFHYDPEKKLLYLSFMTNQPLEKFGIMPLE